MPLESLNGFLGNVFPMVMWWDSLESHVDLLDSGLENVPFWRNTCLN